MIAVGEMAPGFESDSSEGPVNLESLRGAPVVVYFYPEADTPGCTVESKKFRDILPKLTAKGVRVLGVSVDDVPKQRKFADHCSLPFPLVADTTKRISQSYGVLGPSGKARRITFLLDGEGRVVEGVENRDAYLNGLV